MVRKLARLWLDIVVYTASVTVLLSLPIVGALLGKETGHATLAFLVGLLIDITTVAIVLAE